MARVLLRVMSFLRDACHIIVSARKLAECSKGLISRGGQPSPVHTVPNPQKDMASTSKSKGCGFGQLAFDRPSRAPPTTITT